MSIIVIGMGNPLLSDDSAGLITVEHLERECAHRFPAIRFERCYAGGLDLLTELAGFHSAVIVDSIQTHNAPPGFCHRLSLDDIRHCAHARLVGSHGLNIATVLEIGARYGYTMPGRVEIFAIEGIEFEAFSERPTPQVERSIPDVVDTVTALLSTWALPAEQARGISVGGYR